MVKTNTGLDVMNFGFDLIYSNSNVEKGIVGAAIFAEQMMEKKITGNSVFKEQMMKTGTY